MSIYKNDINVSLNIGANTQQAQQQIQALQASLNKLSSAGFGANATKNMKEAAAAAQQLQMHLQKAYNTKTGNLDLGLLNKSLTSANTDINKLSASLIGAGKDGTAAFTNLARSIANANQPMLKTNTLLGNMWTTLKNTARWQISSSILQGFMGSVQKAYQYAQDLNKSLTDIRIVTGYSADRMKDFAVEANNAAKALSTTTNEYAKASLIYFQQGLNDQEVKERTDVTVKMANVTRDSAQVVSDQMTAIWNNFDDGSKSLEYYADVITALGAATASSTDEIAEGLEKFAAVASTVGLSYEYATSALATITAETRQSADVVGTALKTLFARIQGLSLGETLEDGTNLNKYSDALAKVGISIKDQNGGLKDMDALLEEMAAKWQTLNKDQQVALAQTVAGVRQYTQLVALMDNWDAMQVNLKTAANSEGTLQEQQDIYAESWEAASKRVKAALEEIYATLLDDTFFIKLTSTIADLTNGIGEFVKGIGGMKGIITAIAGIFLTNFAHKIPQAVEGVRYNLSVLFGGAAKEAERMTGKFNEMLASSLNNDKLSAAQKQQIEYSQRLLQAKSQLAKINSTLTDSERFQAESAIAQLEAQQREVDELYSKIETLKNSTQGTFQNITGSITDKIEKSFQGQKIGALNSDQYDNLYNANSTMIKNLANEYSKLSDAQSMVNKTSIGAIATEQKARIDELAKSVAKLSGSDLQDAKRESAAFAKSLENLIPQNMSGKAKELKNIIRDIKDAKSGDGLETALKNLSKFMDETKIKGKDLKNILSQMDIPDNIINELSQMGILERKAAKGAEEIKNGFAQLGNVIKHTASTLEHISKAAGGLSSFAMGLNSLKTAMDTLKNPDISGFEKFTSVAMSFGMGLPMLISGLKTLGGSYITLAKAIGISAIAKEKESIVTAQKIIVDKAEKIATFQNVLLKEKELLLSNKLRMASRARTLAKMLGISVETAETVIKKVLNKEMTIEIALKTTLNALDLKRILIYAALVVAIGAVVLIVKSLIKSWQDYKAAQPEEQLKKTREETEKLKEATDQAVQSAENLKSTISSYDEARSSLDFLTQGTEEFKSKVEEANASARELIETLGLVYGTDYTINSQTGLIEVDEERLKNKQNEFDERVEAQRAGEYASRNKELELQNTISNNNFVEKLDRKYTSENYVDYGPGYQSALGQARNAQETKQISEETFDEYTASLFDMVDDFEDGIDSFIDEFKNKPEEIGKKLFNSNELNNEQQHFIEQIKNNSDAFRDLYNSVKNNEAAIEANNRSLMQQALENEQFYQDSEFKATIIAEAAKAYQEAYDKERARLEELSKTEEGKETIYDAYAELMGYYDTSTVDPDTQLRVFTDAMGNKITPSLDAIMAILSGNAGDESGETQGELTSEQMAKLAQTNPELAAFVEQQNGGSQMSYTDQINLQKSLQGGLSNEEAAAQAMGYQSVEDMKMAQHYGAKIDWEQHSNYAKELEGLNPYADLEAAFQSDLKEQMAQQNYLSGLSADSYDINENDADYTAKLEELKGLFSGLSEEEMKIMVSADLDLTKSKEEIQKDIQEVLQAAELEDTYKRTAEATGWSEDAIKSYAQSLMATNDKLKDNELLAAKAAEQNLNFAKGAQDASEVFEEQANVLAKADKNSMEYHEAIGKLTASLNQMLGAKFDSNFLQDTKNMEKFKKAVKGDIDAIKELRKEAAKSVVAKLELKDENFRGKIQSLVSQIQDSMNNLQVGDNISQNFINQLNQMVQAAGMTKAQIEELMNSMGLHAEIEMEVPEVEPEEQKVESKNTANSTVTGSIKVGDTTQEIEGNISTTTETTSNMLVPVIKGAKVASTPKSLGGAAKSNPAPSSGGGGGGGGGGEELKDPKNYEDEIERYHENTRALERLERALDKVTTAKDRAFGKERLRLIEEEIAATERLAAQQKSYLAEIEGYAAIDRSRMEGYGFTFDEHGEITNYNEIYRQQVDKFNASRTDAAEEEYNKFKETVEQYEETITLLDEEQMKYQEYLNSLVDLKLEKITTEVEVKIRVNDIELTKLEYMLKKLQREGASAADEIKNIADQINETMEKAGPIQEAIDKIYEQARAEGRGLNAQETAEIQSFYADGVIDAQEQERVNAIYAKADAEDRMLTQAEEDQIQEYKEQLLQLNEEVWDLADAIEGKLAEELDELGAEFDENINRLTSYTQMYENLQNVLELTGKSKTAEGLNALNQLAASTLKNSTNALKANKANYDTFVELAAEANRHLQEAIEVGDQHMIDYWTEQVEDVTIRMEEAHVAMLESFNDALEAAGDLFDTKVENMITKLKKDLGDLDTMVELYDRAVELENLYLSSNQSIYELSKLTREVGKSIEDTSNLIAKNKLNDLMKELNKLRAESVQLSKYDLEYLQAKYELELAEIALQEAQEAKSQVKLTRNNEGGWGYVYTADSDKVAEAEQNFENKTYNMQQLNADYITDYSEQLLKNRQEMMDALANIDKTREDYDAEVLRVKEEYMAKEEFYVSELTKAYERQGVAYEDTILGMISNDESLLESHENFKDRTLEIIDEELIPAHEEWLGNVQDVCDEAGYSYDELTDGVLENMDNVNEASTKLTEKTLKEQEDMRESMKETMQEIKNWQLQYLETIDAMVAANEAYYEKTIADYSNAMNQIVATAQAAFDAIVNAAQAAAAALSKLGGDAVENSNPYKEDPPTSPDVVKVERYSHGGRVTYYADGTTSGSSNGGLLVETITSGAGDGNGAPPPNGYTSWANYRDDQDFLRNGNSINLYDTGGYTGSWGSGWKLAGLHEKELVLNKHDTKNMLDMVNTLRDIDWRAKLSELWANIEDQFINPVFGGTEELLQQVHIEANFPDLKDHFEIEEAFHNLINTASQYANRKHI